MKRFLLILLLISLLFSLSLGGCFLKGKLKGPESAPAVQTGTPAPKTTEATIVAAGDCLMHNTQIWSGLQPDGSYCFDSFFADVKEYISAGDYSITNLETPLAGPETGYTGYPLFNSPDAIADTLKRAGFDLVVTANNHTMDRGHKGALRTIEVLQKAGLETVGTYKSEAESQTLLVKDINGIEIGIIAYSYGTNGIPVRDDKSYLINLLDAEEILRDISRLKPQVDVVILILHWGIEYMPEPTLEQRNMAYEFLTAGADIIIGSHPHVIQEMEIVRIGDKDKLVIYSMGNFISHQIGEERNSGVLMKLKLVKDVDKGDTILDSVSYLPTFSHHYYEEGKMGFRVVPVEKTLINIENGFESYLSDKDIPVLKTVLAKTRNQLGEPFNRH